MRHALLLFCVLGIIASALAQPLESTARFRRGTDRYYKSGALRQCELVGVMDLQGYPCQSWIWFHENGALKEFQLAESADVRGIGFPARTWLNLNEDGSLNYVFLPRMMVIQNVPCAGSRLGREGITTAFHRNSNLRECYLAFSATVRNVPLHAGAFSPVELYADGSLKSGWLAEPYEADGTLYARKTHLVFSEEGMVIEAYHRNWFGQAWIDVLDIIF